MVKLGRVISETAYLYKWPARTVLWGMDVAELIWWWQTGWAAWAKEHGINLAPKTPGGSGPDKAAFRARYGPGNVVGR